MRNALLPALLAAALAAHPAGAQDPDSATRAGVLADGPTLTEGDSYSRCLELGSSGSDAERGTDALDTTCEIADGGELERTGDRRWLWMRYTHTTLLPPASSQQPEARDTMREEEVVLFSAPLDGSPLTAEWHARYSRDDWRGVDVAIGPTPDDGALMGVLWCVNGTGGCEQHFLLRGPDGWRPVRQRWPEQLPDRVDGGFSKGTYINPLTLQGRAALYSPDDANCCPSRMLYFRVRLQGDALVLRDHRAVRLSVD